MSKFAGMKGFTLLEVLIALAVLAISLIAVLNNINVQTQNNAHLVEKTLAHWVGLNKVTELQVQRHWPTVGTQKNHIQMANQKWYWEVEVDNTEDKNVRRVVVQVAHENRPDQVLDSLTTYIKNPAF